MTEYTQVCVCVCVCGLCVCVCTWDCRRVVERVTSAPSIALCSRNHFCATWWGRRGMGDCSS
ncbi:MAG: hypothetical protein P4L40_14345 [Terracidiphilus sp.]|nr:hypothetical protein [Terracidiphilus sp.]